MTRTSRNFRFGSEADEATLRGYVRFTPESGHPVDAPACPLCPRTRSPGENFLDGSWLSPSRRQRPALYDRPAWGAHEAHDCRRIAHGSVVRLTCRVRNRYIRWVIRDRAACGMLDMTAKSRSIG